MMKVLRRVKRLYCIVNDNDNVNSGGDNDDEVEGVVVDTKNSLKKNNEHTNNKIVKTIKLLNEIQPSSNLLNLVYQTINLPDNSEEYINSNIDTTTRYLNKIKPTTNLLNLIN